MFYNHFFCYVCSLCDRDCWIGLLCVRLKFALLALVTSTLCCARWSYLVRVTNVFRSATKKAASPKSAVIFHVCCCWFFLLLTWQQANRRNLIHLRIQNEHFAQVVFFFHKLLMRTHRLRLFMNVSCFLVVASFVHLFISRACTISNVQLLQIYKFRTYMTRRESNFLSRNVLI